MKKHQLSVSIDADLADILQTQANDERLSMSAVLNRAVNRALRSSAPAAAPAATPAATPAAAPRTPYDEAWKKWKAVPEPKDDAEALALCKAAGMDMNYITETNARLAWTLYMELGEM